MLCLIYGIAPKHPHLQGVFAWSPWEGFSLGCRFFAKNVRRRVLLNTFIIRAGTAGTVAARVSVWDAMTDEMRSAATRLRPSEW